jgi:phage protein D
METAATWGIGDITVFTPNVRVNPEAEAAAAQKQKATEDMVTLATRAKRVTALAKVMSRTAKVNPDLALTTVAAMGGQQGITVENKTINFSGMPEVIGKLGEALINKLKP